MSLQVYQTLLSICKIVGNEQKMYWYVFHYG